MLLIIPLHTLRLDIRVRITVHGFVDANDLSTPRGRVRKTKKIETQGKHLLPTKAMKITNQPATKKKHVSTRLFVG